MLASTPTLDAGRLEMSEAEFARVARLAYAEAGLVIHKEKRAMVQSRLTRHVRRLGCTGFAAYLDLVESQSVGEERQLFLSALTTNVTSFFRESHHFDVLRQTVGPALVQKARAGGRVRLWSAGCSFGQEPYSIALSLLELDSQIASRDVQILATDIDRTAVEAARAGIYTDAQLAGLSQKQRNEHFRQAGADRYAVTEPLRGLVTVRQLNLQGSWPMKRPFDVIFCRNVVIYFDLGTQNRLWPRFVAQLVDGGRLYLGHSERIQNPGPLGLRVDGTTAYRKEAAPPSASDQKGADRVRP